jgi:deoxyinosine 3'endonuclease (endonuclease V)
MHEVRYVVELQTALAERGVAGVDVGYREVEDRRAVAVLEEQPSVPEIEERERNTIERRIKEIKTGSNDLINPEP